MTTLHRSLSTFAPALFFMLPHSVSAATILTGINVRDGAVPANHGSRAIGTPNVTLQWSPVTGSPEWESYDNAGWTNASSVGGSNTGLYEFDSALTAPKIFLIAFTPDAGFNVVLNQLDMNAYSGTAYNYAFDWTVTGETSGELGTGTWNVPNSANTIFSLGGLMGADSEKITLKFQVTAGTSGNGIAMDNLSFDQLPEPSSLLLSWIGLLACLSAEKGDCSGKRHLYARSQIVPSFSPFCWVCSDFLRVLSERHLYPFCAS